MMAKQGGNLFPLQKTSKTKNCQKCFSKIVFGREYEKFLLLGKFHNALKTKTGQLSQK